jgi:hypothetical protein
MKRQNMTIELLAHSIVFRAVKDHRNLPDKVADLNWFKIRRATWCKVIGPTSAGTGIAFCSVKDVYDPEVGRRLSLRRAVKSFSREDRTLIWREYLIYAAAHGLVLAKDQEKAHRVGAREVEEVMKRAQETANRLLSRAMHRASLKAKAERRKQAKSKQAGV